MLHVTIGLARMVQSAIAVVYNRMQPWGSAEIINMSDGDLYTSCYDIDEIDSMRSRLNIHAILLVYSIGIFLMYVDRGAVDGMAGVFVSQYDLTMRLYAAVPTFFTIVYAIASPLFGYVCKNRRIPETLVTVIGMVLFVHGTLITAFAYTNESKYNVFVQIVTGRVFVALGNAAYLPIIMSLLYNMSNSSQVAFFIGSTQIAVILGMSCGYVAAGVVSWHYIFIVETLMGVVMCVFLIGICNASVSHGILSIFRQRTAAQLDSVQVHWLMRLRSRVHVLLTNRVFVNLVASNVIITFIVSAMAFWTPYYYHVQYGFSSETASVCIGVVSGLAGVTGSLFGMWCMWYHGKKESINLTIVLNVCAFIGALGLIVLRESAWMFSAMFVIVEIFIFAQTTSFTDALCTSVLPSDLTFALSVNAMTMHLFGDVVSPVLFGWIVHCCINLSMALPAYCVGAAMACLYGAKRAWSSDQ